MIEKMLPTPFPEIDVSDDYNPAIRLFGKRFFADQTVLEYLTEFMAIIYSKKWINGLVIKNPLPTREELKAWPKNKLLHYKVPVRLNLKLFAFLSSSPIDKRDKAHKEHYIKLFEELDKKIVSSQKDKENIKQWIEQFLSGYYGVGSERSWSARTFYPISTALLTRETVLNTKKRITAKTWDETIRKFKTYFTISGRLFTARGGEILYLQLCNLFTHENKEIKEFAQMLGLPEKEYNLDTLHESLQSGFEKISQANSKSLDKLINLIDSLDEDTQKFTNDLDENKDQIPCGWCPRASWQEAYLFAIEINRILQAGFDPVERLELLMTGCILQVLRSLCAQSSRYSIYHEKDNGGLLGYAWIFSDPYSSNLPTKLAAQRNLEVVQALIQQSLRDEIFVENAEKDPAKAKDILYMKKLYNKADDKYGHKLFVSLAKKLGIVAPYKGPGARFIMTDKLLRFLVAALLEPGESCTIDEFLDKLYLHYGIAVTGKYIENALKWSKLPSINYDDKREGSWIDQLLYAGGFLTKLSDSCSVVKNTFPRM